VSDHSSSEEPVIESQWVHRPFKLFTNGEQPFVDRLAIIMELMREMEDNERRAALGYVSDYYGYRVLPK